MKPQVTIHNRQCVRPVDARQFRRIAQVLLVEWLQIEQAALGICLVAEPEMARLNETFLRHKGSTDVITFDYTNCGGQRFVPVQKGKAATKRCPPLHGEIFICVDEAVRQAGQFRTSWQSEIVRYLIHGVLHLLGHDDLRAGERRKMKREENRLLGRLSRRFSLAQLGRAARISGCTNR